MLDCTIIDAFNKIADAIIEAGERVNGSGLPAVGTNLISSGCTIRGVLGEVIDKTMEGYLNGTETIPLLLARIEPGRYDFPNYLYQSGGDQSVGIPFNRTELMTTLASIYGARTEQSRFVYHDSQDNVWIIRQTPSGDYNFDANVMVPTLNMSSLWGQNRADIHYGGGITAPYPFNLQEWWVNGARDTVLMAKYGLTREQLDSITSVAAATISTCYDRFNDVDLNLYRQPLDYPHIVLPITSDVTLKYKGGRNRPGVKGWVLVGPAGESKEPFRTPHTEFLSMHLPDFTREANGAVETLTFLRSLRGTNVLITCDCKESKELIDKLLRVFYPTLVVQPADAFEATCYVQVYGGRTVVVDASVVGHETIPETELTNESWFVRTRPDGWCLATQGDEHLIVGDYLEARLEPTA